MATLSPRDPFTGKSTGNFELHSFAEVEGKISALVEAQKLWKRRPLSQRVSLVREACAYFTQNAEAVALDICEQMGRPLHQAQGELKGFFERAFYLCDIAEDVLSPDELMKKPSFDRSIEHVPLGLVFVISAWNYPLLIAVNSVVPGLIAGNCILLKHSSLTPKIGEHFENAFGHLDGLQVLSQVRLDHSTTGRAIEELPVDHVVFTGSVSGGRQILKHTSQRFMTPTLELGGKDAAYVHKDAEIQHAAETVVDGAMFNSGQSCCGIERAYVHKDIYEDFIAACEKIVTTYKMGDPKDPTTNLGPLAQAKSVSEMQRQVDEAQALGAKVLVGGRSENIGEGVFFQPTLVVEVKNSMKIMQEENFGPLLPIMKVENLQEAVSLVNDSAYGLTAAIFTQDAKAAKEFSEGVEAGTVFMNRCDYLDPALAWTGYKNSGCGSSLSRYGFYNLTRLKSLHFKTKI